MKHPKSLNQFLILNDRKWAATFDGLCLVSLAVCKPNPTELKSHSCNVLSSLSRSSGMSSSLDPLPSISLGSLPPVYDGVTSVESSSQTLEGDDSWLGWLVASMSVRIGVTSFKRTEDAAVRVWDPTQLWSL